MGINLHKNHWKSHAKYDISHGHPWGAENRAESQKGQNKWKVNMYVRNIKLGNRINSVFAWYEREALFSPTIIMVSNVSWGKDPCLR